MVADEDQPASASALASAFAGWTPRKLVLLSGCHQKHALRLLPAAPMRLPQLLCVLSALAPIPPFASISIRIARREKTTPGATAATLGFCSAGAPAA